MTESVTVRCLFLSDILKQFGTFPKTETILVTAKSDVFRIKSKDKLEFLGISSAFGRPVREDPMAPRYKIINTDGDYSYVFLG